MLPMFEIVSMSVCKYVYQYTMQKAMQACLHS